MTSLRVVLSFNDGGQPVRNSDGKDRPVIFFPAMDSDVAAGRRDASFGEDEIEKMRRDTESAESGFQGTDTQYDPLEECDRRGGESVTKASRFPEGVTSEVMNPRFIHRRAARFNTSSPIIPDSFQSIAHGF